MPSLPSSRTRTEVLVVDDDADIRESLRLILEYAGYTVYESPDGRPALEQLQTHPQGMVVVLDLNMPGMDGVALLRTLAADPDLLARHRVIMVTARAGDTLPQTDAQLIARRTAALLPKPFELDALLDAVAEASASLRA